MKTFLLSLTFVLCCSYASGQCLPEFTHRGDVNGSGGNPNILLMFLMVGPLRSVLKLLTLTVMALLTKQM